ncbi:hypothetical protein ACNQGP_01805 [Flavobacterium sp. GT2N3]
MYTSSIYHNKYDISEYRAIMQDFETKGGFNLLLYRM